MGSLRLGWLGTVVLAWGAAAWGQGVPSPLQTLQDVDYWRNLCDLQAAAAQYREAQAACEAAIALAPREDGLWARHSGILLAQDQHPRAIASAQQALRFNPRNSLAHTRICQAHYALGNLDLALDACNAALRVDGSWGNQSPALAWLHRGLVLAAQGDPAAALVAYGRTLLLEPEDSRTRFHECEAQLALENYTGAIASCQAALAGTGRWGPTSPAQAWLNQGIAHFRRSQLTEATAAFDRALDLDPQLTLAWIYQGRVLAARNLPMESLVSFTQAVTLEGNSARALLGQCTALNRTRQYEPAVAACQAALQDSDGVWWELGPAEAWSQLAQGLTGVGQFEAALAATSRAVGLRPGYGDAWADRGVVLWYLQDYEAAIAATQEAIRLGDSAPRPWNNLGSIFRSLGQYAAALTAYDAALQRDPSNVATWANRSVAQWHLTDYEGAVLSANQAINLNPRATAGWYNRGTALMPLGRYEEALDAFAQVVTLQPDNSNGWTGLGLALGQLGRFAEARQALTRAITLSPGPTIAQEILSALPPPTPPANGAAPPTPQRSPLPVLPPSAP